jgi:TPR repeat protein
VEEDLGEAIFWMGLAADAGYEPARDWLEDMAFDDNASVQAWA